jgi:hypothetical protein
MDWPADRPTLGWNCWTFAFTSKGVHLVWFLSTVSSCHTFYRRSIMGLTRNWHFLTREIHAYYIIISLHEASVKYAHHMAFSQLSGDFWMTSYHVTNNVDSSLYGGTNLSRARPLLQKCTSMRILLNYIVLLMYRISTVCKFRTKAHFARTVRESFSLNWNS